MLHDIPIYFMAQWCSDQDSTGQDAMPQILPRTYPRNIRWAGDFGVLVNPLELFITAHVMHVVWPSAIVLLLSWQGLSKTLSGWAFGVKEHPHECQHPGFPSRTSHSKMITVIQGFNVAERCVSTQEVELKLRLFSSACLWFLHMSASNRDVLNKSQLVHERMCC